MFFELRGVTYQIRFSRTGTTTFAHLFRVENDGTLHEMEGVGIAELFHTDRFEKAKGRKVAVADLLWKYSVPDSEGEIPEGLSKENREEIWKKYFEQHIHDKK